MEGSAATVRRAARTARAGPKAILALLLALSALLVSAAMSSPALAWLGWISLLPLFAAIRVLPPKFAALAGVWWGAALALGHAWFAGAGGSSVILGIVRTVCVIGLYTGLGAALTRRIGFSPLVLAVGWIGVELALLPLGWRDGLLAATQSDTSLPVASSTTSGLLRTSPATTYAPFTSPAAEPYFRRSSVGSD